MVPDQYTDVTLAGNVPSTPVLDTDGTAAPVMVRGRRHYY